MSYLDFLVQLNSEQWGSMGFILVLLLSYVVTFFYLRGNETRYSYVWYTGLMIVLVANPITYYVMRMLLPENEIINRIRTSFAVLPISFIIAIAIALAVSYVKKNFYKWIIGFLSVGVVALFGGLVYSQNIVELSVDAQKVPKAVLEASEFFSEKGNDSVSILAGEKISPYLRQVDLRFNMRLSGDDEILTELNLDSEKAEVENAVATMEEYGQDYIMIYSSPFNSESLEEYDYKLIADMSGYGLYERNTDTDRWVVTSVADASGKPGSGYILYNGRNKQLIIIDGGYSENTEYFREKINLLGGHVTAWYITNYSAEHASVIIDILSEPQGIKVDNVYDNGITLDTYKKYSGEQDDMRFFLNYVDVVRPKVKISVKRDRHLYYSGMTIKVLNTFDDQLLEWTTDDVLDNSSLVLQMRTSESAMLYCSDLHSAKVARKLLSTYGNNLRSDYIVVPNHGDRAIPSNTAFYTMVAPKVAFFDTPEEYLKTDEHSVAELWNYLIDRRKVDCRLSGDVIILR